MAEEEEEGEYKFEWREKVEKRRAWNICFVELSVEYFAFS